MTAMQKKPHNPVAHLTAQDIEEIGRKLDADTPMIDAVLALIKLREGVNQGTARAIDGKTGAAFAQPQKAA